MDGKRTVIIFDSDKSVIKYGAGNMDFVRVTEMLSTAFLSKNTKNNEIKKAFMPVYNINLRRCLARKSM